MEGPLEYQVSQRRDLPIGSVDGAKSSSLLSGTCSCWHCVHRLIGPRDRFGVIDPRQLNRLLTG